VNQVPLELAELVACGVVHQVVGQCALLQAAVVEGVAQLEEPVTYFVGSYQALMQIFYVKERLMNLLVL